MDPLESIDDQEKVDWCRSLVSGDQSYEDFSSKVKDYDTTTVCGLVWSVDFWFYRCHTCGIPQCISLCPDCFNGGNHEGTFYSLDYVQSKCLSLDYLKY